MTEQTFGRFLDERRMVALETKSPGSLFLCWMEVMSQKWLKDV